MCLLFSVFFFKQKTAYEMRISDWSSDVCSSDLSPFDYAAQARIFVVRDVKANDVDQVAAAYREFFLAAGGGGLGLFTAIHRLRAVHERMKIGRAPCRERVCQYV